MELKVTVKFGEETQILTFDTKGTRFDAYDYNHGLSNRLGNIGEITLNSDIKGKVTVELNGESEYCYIFSEGVTLDDIIDTLNNEIYDTIFN